MWIGIIDPAPRVLYLDPKGKRCIDSCAMYQVWMPSNPKNIYAGKQHINCHMLVVQNTEEIPSLYIFL